MWILCLTISLSLGFWIFTIVGYSGYLQLFLISNNNAHIAFAFMWENCSWTIQNVCNFTFELYEICALLLLNYTKYVQFYFWKTSPNYHQVFESQKDVGVYFSTLLPAVHMMSSLNSFNIILLYFGAFSHLFFWPSVFLFFHELPIHMFYFFVISSFSLEVETPYILKVNPFQNMHVTNIFSQHLFVF